MSRLLYAVYGDPTAPRTQSGVAARLGDALDRRSELTVERVDTSLSRPVLAIAAARNFRRGVHSWRSAVHWSPLATRTRTRALVRQLQRRQLKPDAVLQLRAVYRPIDAPYIPYLDSTVHLSLEHWAPLAPWRGRRLSAVLDDERSYFGEAAHLFVTGGLVADSL